MRWSVWSRLLWPLGLAQAVPDPTRPRAWLRGPDPAGILPRENDDLVSMTMDKSHFQLIYMIELGQASNVSDELRDVFG